MYFYQRLRDLREDYDKTQKEIAKILNMQYQQYARYENGEREMPMHHFITLARYYDVSLDYLAGLIDKPRTIEGVQKSTYQKKINISNKGNNNKFNIKQ